MNHSIVELIPSSNFINSKFEGMSVLAGFRNCPLGLVESNNKSSSLISNYILSSTTNFEPPLSEFRKLNGTFIL